MMAGRSFTRHSNGIGNRIRAEHINELQSALEEDDARIDLKTDDGQFTAHVDDTNNPHNVTKAQIGLGNVDNTADADKPVSTAQQAALDGKADVDDAVPEGGVYGQVLTVTHSGREWVDPPGIVYPSLLLSPDGSFDRNGAVSPTIVGDVQQVAGQHGQAWKFDAEGEYISTPSELLPGNASGTILVRVRFGNAGANTQLVFSRYSSEGFLLFGRSNLNGVINIPSLNVGGGPIVLDTWMTIGAKWGAGQIGLAQSGQIVATGTYAGNSGANASGRIGSYTQIASRQMFGEVEAFITYPIAIPDAEIARISNMPTAWTMQNTAVNMALQSQPPATPSGSSLLSYYPPNRKIAAGGTTLRTAPGTTAPTITTLAAGTDVHDTRQTVSVSSVSYSLVVTAFGNAWVPTSTLV